MMVLTPETYQLVYWSDAIPNGSLLNLYLLKGVMLVVSFADSGTISICQNPEILRSVWLYPTVLRKSGRHALLYCKLSYGVYSLRGKEG